jgi:hypothetical protein
MKSRPFHSLLLALALCAGSSSFVSTATAQAADPVAAAVLVLQEELLDATTASAVAAAKAKALAAGVPWRPCRQPSPRSVRNPSGSVPSACAGASQGTKECQHRSPNRGWLDPLQWRRHPRGWYQCRRYRLYVQQLSAPRVPLPAASCEAAFLCPGCAHGAGLNRNGLKPRR